MERCENPKNGIKGNLNVIRLEINNNDNESIEYKSRKIKIFTLHIEKRIISLLNKVVCRNAEIIESYYKLNKIKTPFKELGGIEISRFKTLKDIDINVLELYFKKRLEDIIFKLNLIPITSMPNLQSLLSTKHFTNGETSIPDINIKTIFKNLEILNKEINSYYKVHGYLKERRNEKAN